MTESTPQVTSNVSVDPGEIRSYARFLQDMETELAAARTELIGNRGRAARAFGSFDRADTAVNKHDAALEGEIEVLEALITRFSELTEGTIQMSRTYADLEELNRTNGAQVSALLNEGDQ